jgi:hypothetical protein
LEAANYLDDDVPVEVAAIVAFPDEAVDPVPASARRI